MGATLFIITFTLFFVALVFRYYWLAPSRFNALFSSMMKDGATLFSLSMSIVYLLLSLLLTLRILNLISNFPVGTSFTLYYFFSITISLVLWLSLFVVLLRTQIYSFLSHMIPYGAPIFLIFLLPIVELFSQLIRPLTLIIRLSTNLSSGHIILIMFSYFSLSSSFIAFFIVFLLVFLLVLEVTISLLQAYIFSSLSSIYISERI